VRVSAGPPSERTSDGAPAPEAEPATQTSPIVDAESAELAVRPRLNLSELVVGGALLAIALLAWVALALAHLGWFSLGAAIGVWVAVCLVVVAACWKWAPLSVRFDKAGCGGVVVIGAIAAFMVLPGFHYGVTDKDPGAYVAHAISIARTGSYDIVDPTLDGRIPGGPVLTSPGARFAAEWLRGDGSDVIVPQFYHLWPALMAVTYDIDGETGLSNTGPVLAVLAILAAALALRRAVASAPWGNETSGLGCGAVAGLLLATNMLEVWQSKYPSSEISAQMLFMGALLGLVLALTTRWRPAAGAAGVLVGIGFLDRADGELLIGLSVVALAAVIAIRRWDSRATWFAAGLAIVLPHALWQAYSYDAAGRYTADNNVPTLPKLALSIIAVLVVGFALRSVGPKVARWVTHPRIQLRLGLVITALAAFLLALGFFRPRFFGADYGIFTGGVRARTFDEQAMARLSWFISVPGFLLMLLGVAIVSLRRWGGALWVLTAPLLAIFPVYAYKARNSTRLLWWSRRYLPTVLPLVLLMIALALGLALTAVIARRNRIVGWLGGQRVWALRLAAVASIVGLLAFYLSESWPLRDHDEFGGSFAITKRIAADAGGKQGVFLWQLPPGCCGYAEQLFGAAIWLERGQVSALLPGDDTRDAGYIQSFVKGFPGQPVFVIWHGQAQPQIPGVQLTVADRVVTSLPFWEESDLHRPKKSINIAVSFVVYRAVVTS
jgi:hypothetical protein